MKKLLFPFILTCFFFSCSRDLYVIDGFNEKMLSSNSFSYFWSVKNKDSDGYFTLFTNTFLDNNNEITYEDLGNGIIAPIKVFTIGDIYTKKYYDSNGDYHEEIIENPEYKIEKKNWDIVSITIEGITYKSK